MHNWVQDKANAILINASRMDEEFDGVATGLTACVTKDGQTTITANLPMAGFKHTGVGAAAARTDYARVAELVDGGHVFAVAGGTTDALTLTISPAITGYAAGQLFWARLTATNATTTPTLAVSGLTAKTIVKRGGNAVAVGDLLNGAMAGFSYNANTDKFEIVSPPGAVTGTGKIVHDTSPTLTSATLVTPNIGAATATSLTFANEAMQTYDEGTWTFTYSPSSGAITSYTRNTCYYTKIGNVVDISGWITVNAVGTAAGTVSGAGLPFTSKNNSGALSALSFHPDTWDATLTTPISGYVQSNATTIFMGKFANGGVTPTGLGDDLANNCNLVVGGMYFAATP